MQRLPLLNESKLEENRNVEKRTLQGKIWIYRNGFEAKRKSSSKDAARLCNLNFFFCWDEETEELRHAIKAKMNQLGVIRTKKNQLGIGEEIDRRFAASSAPQTSNTLAPEAIRYYSSALGSGFGDSRGLLSIRPKIYAVVSGIKRFMLSHGEESPERSI